MKTYFTFGQSHVHSVGGRTFDKDCVVAIEAENWQEARKIMFATFGPRWAFQYDTIEQVKIEYYPRGVIEL